MITVQVPRRFTADDWGGTETVILETSKRLISLGHPTEILCPNALAARDNELIEGVPVRRFPYFYPYIGLSAENRQQLDKKAGNLFSFALRTALLNYPSLQLIHLHTGKRLGGIARAVARRRHIPYVVSLHGGVHDVPAAETESWTSPTQGTWEWGKLLGYWVGSRNVLHDANAIICVGAQEQRETQKRFPSKHVIQLPNGVNPLRFLNGDGRRFRSNFGLRSEAILLLIVGRIDPQKNQAFVIRALREITAFCPEIHLACVGHVTNERYRDELIQLAREMGVQGRVSIIPGLEAGSQDLVDAYHAADYFVLPSIHEPFGIVILEAWAAGRPVLASRVGGIPAFVEDRKDGVLFEPDKPEQFIGALRDLLLNPGKAREMAESGRGKAASEYSWDRATQRLIDLYEEVLRENPLR